jgi:alpha-beta hydrolase superfamily lysophospholipase
MLEAAPDLGDPERLKAIRSDLPIYLTAGEADPVGGGGQLVQLVADRYRQAGVGDVTVDVYPGARHEVFNETNRDEVVANLVAWLDRVTVR